MTANDAKEGVLDAVRAGMSPEQTMPDPDLEVLGRLLASMELRIKSVSWDMVKRELTNSREFQDLGDWIIGGGAGPHESFPDYGKQFWRFREKMRVMDMVPMMGERTVILKGLRRQVLHSAHQGVLSMGR